MTGPAASVSPLPTGSRPRTTSTRTHKHQYSQATNLGFHGGNADGQTEPGLSTDVDPAVADNLIYRFDRSHTPVPSPGFEQTDPIPPFPPSEPDTDADNESLIHPSDDADSLAGSLAWGNIREGSIARRKWYRKPRPIWLISAVVLHTISMSMLISPKAELYTSLTCLVHYPATSDKPTTSNPIEDGPVGYPGSDAPSLPTVPRPKYPATHPQDGDKDQEGGADDDQTPNLVTYITTDKRSMDESFPLTTTAPPVRIDPVLCRRSPDVQKATAEFVAVITVTQGSLAALTTGWWGKLSDRVGRTKVMALAIAGLCMNDLVFLLTAHFPHLVPGGYRFIILGPLIDGLFGGMPTLTATNHAYIADSTPDGTRAQVYSRMAGIMMLVFSLGPTIGSRIIDYTGTIFSVFYISIIVQVVLITYIFLVLPESLSTEARNFLTKAAQRKKQEDMEREEAEREWENDQLDLSLDAGASGWSRISARVGNKHQVQGRLRRSVKRLFSFTAPLAIFLPQVDENDPRGKKNWNLTFLAMGQGCMMIMMGVMSVKFSYLQLVYGWGPDKIGPYLTLTTGVRACVLLVLLPTTVAFLKRKSPHPPQSNRSLSRERTEEELNAPQAKTSKSLEDSRFDVNIIRVSLFIDLFAYLGVCLASNSEQFVIATALAPLGSGAGPAISSLALGLIPSSRAAGRLFGGISVLQAMVGIIGPVLFGLLFANTTNIFPKAVFVLAFVLLCTAFIIFNCIRIALPEPLVEDGSSRYRDEERGRDRNIKPVNSSGFTIRVDRAPTTPP